MKSWNSFLVRLISFFVLIVAAPMAQALPDECTNLTAPATFLKASSLVCLQKIIVTDSSGDQLYKASLQWLGADNPNRFKLLSVEFDDASVVNSPTFSFLNGVLILPKVDAPKLYGTERYTVSLAWVTDTDEDADDPVSVFELATVALYNNPGYIPNTTWKPYGMLLSDERRAVDLLGRSISYAKLADAIYDYDNVAVDSWKLIESNGKSSGMDAGVYKNSDTNELALAFRGTETCDFPCSFKELEDTASDAVADVAIGIGTVSDQFKETLIKSQKLVKYAVDRNHCKGAH